ncbi:long-chain acyl-CoA synthetase [Longimycelium tulufanense]|uniref:Acyl-CoA synthetase n=1 Tax=Longimycelium tulufanense TaxID=907463 RepID=A0A8J3CEH5_9PSEU|nr:AMP-dependent synthetase/ligase [Longimycelium tulufanense]GGM83109.1 long-chain acyl-CoA synthetase [Longimycelium tulufanense]
MTGEDRGTLLDLLHRNATEHADVPALVDGEQQLTWAEYQRQSSALALALLDLGVTRGDVVGLHMVNRVEHALADIGALLAGATPTSYYNTLSPEQLAYVTRDSACTVAIVDADMLDAWLTIRDELPALSAILVLDVEAPTEGVRRFDVQLARATQELESRIGEVTAAAARVRPDDPVTVVYTSGTTGRPKGTIITHAGVRAVLDATTARVVGELGLHPDPGLCQVSYLPLAHMAERMITHYFSFEHASTVHFVRDLQQLPQVLPRARPHLFLGVPRVWEKFHSAIIDRAASQPSPVRRALGTKAMDIARRVGQAKFGRRRLDLATRLWHAVFDRVVYRKIRRTLGFDRILIAVSGAAPVSRETLAFFHGIGITIIEAYGMTETSALLTINDLRDPRPGSVGTAISGVELRIADDGEILARGANIVPGYLNRPDATAEAFDADGWLHTGDLGSIDKDGHLSIRGRKKELIITAGGKNISPANVEQAIADASELIGPVYVHGDARPYLVALITLDPTSWQSWCSARGIHVATLADAVAHPQVRAEVERAVEAGNATLSRVEQVKRWVLLDREWDSTTGELTPTLKLKRSVIRENHAGDLGRLYD